MLTDALTPRQFSELTDLDYEVAELLYTTYAADQEEYGRIVGGISSYKVPLMDMLMFVYEKSEEGYVTLAGAAILMAIMVFALFNDVTKFFR